MASELEREREQELEQERELEQELEQERELEQEQELEHMKLRPRKNPRSRLTWDEKLTIVTRIDEARGEGVTLKEACAHYGISTSTYWQWDRTRTLVVKKVDLKKKVVTVKGLA